MLRDGGGVNIVEQDLISKKELLILTGISYSQLYRWKRKDLIPDEWFIKKAASTGQETYFPKDKILTRIDKILNMKEGMSLDKLADVFSSSLVKAALYKEEIIQRNIVQRITLDFFQEQTGNAEVFAFDKILYLFLLEKMLQTGEMNMEEGKLLLNVLTQQYKNFSGKNCELLFIRKMGIPVFILISNPAEIYFDNGTKLVMRLNIFSCIEELNIKMP
jgi:DNA-binding transcriptional MerR regulator